MEAMNKEELAMKTFYKSLYRGWVEITEQQKENLVKHMENGITALSNAEKQNYIKGKFKIVEVIK